MTDLSHRLRPLNGRSASENHRVASSLELLFDLTFVVAFTFAGNGLAHSVANGHAGWGILGFAFSMFAIIWAWINFTWFASAFDNDDWLYRLTTMVQMIGVLILALGIPQVFHGLEDQHELHNTVVVIGYVIMRVAMMFQWLRLAKQDPEYAVAARTYATAIAIAQAGWLITPFIHDLRVAAPIYVVLLMIEFSSPMIAERKNLTPWHAHHIAERYGLLAIITLGEGIAGATAALSAVITETGWGWNVAAAGVATVGITFAIWWGYFTIPVGEVLHHDRSKAFGWGYSSILIIGSIAAVGAGFHVVALQMEGGHGEHAIAPVTAILFVAVPVAIVMIGLILQWSWLLESIDFEHIAIAGGMVVVLGLATFMAANHVSMPLCLLVLALAPTLMVIAIEWFGVRHTEEALERRFG